MRIFEVEVEKSVPTPDGEIEAANKINIVREEDGDLYAQLRTDLDAPYRTNNSSYFDQSKAKLATRELPDSEYFNNFEFPSDDSLNTSDRKVTITYLPGRNDSFEKSFSGSGTYTTDYVPFLNDLFGLEDERVFGSQVFQEVQDEVAKEDISQEEFLDWISTVEREMYEMLLDSFDQLSDSEEFFYRDVVDEKQSEKKAFVEYVAREVMNQQKQRYGETGPNNLPADEVFDELPGWDEIKGDLPHTGEQSHFETEFKDIFGRNLVNHLNQKNEREEAEALEQASGIESSDSETTAKSDGGRNILKETGVNSIEGILTMKPEEVTSFLGGSI